MQNYTDKFNEYFCFTLSLLIEALITITGKYERRRKKQAKNEEK